MPHGYSLSDVVDILGVPRGVVAGFVDAGLVKPARGPRREYRFGFADLVVMRAAKALLEADVPPRRLTRALRRLRDQLPDDAPRRGLRIESDGNALVVSEGRTRWRADSGQFVLAFEVAARNGSIAFVERTAPAARDAQAADRWLRRGIEREAADTGEARAAYVRAIEADPALAPAYVNLGRMLHEAGDLGEAMATYERALAGGVADATLLFNLGVLSEDLAMPERAADAYARAIALDPCFADAHYNLALLHAASGRERDAVRHFNAYRQLTRGGGR